MYLARHENSRSWVDFEDFGFYRLQPLDIYYVGGFGVMGWVSGEDYKYAKSDPLAEAAPGIMSHMNADHVQVMILLARTHAGYEATEAAMTAVDRLGFFLMLKAAEGMKGIHINFLREVATAQDTRKVLVGDGACCRNNPMTGQNQNSRIRSHMARVRALACKL